MALTARQRRLYVHRMRTYCKKRNGAGDFVFQVHIESAPCYFFATTNTDHPTQVGLAKQDNIFTYDNVHFEAGLDVDGQDVIEDITSGHLLTKYKLMGEPDVHYPTETRPTNYAHAFLNMNPSIPIAGEA